MSRQEVLPSGMSLDEQKMFWSTYNKWLSTASDQEIEQLEMGLQLIESQEARHLATAIGQQMVDEQRRRLLPANLVQQLEVVHWPVAVAHG